MSIRIDLLGEPKLQFGDYFEHEDSKTGLAEYGPEVDGFVKTRERP